MAEGGRDCNGAAEYRRPVHFASADARTGHGGLRLSAPVSVLRSRDSCREQRIRVRPGVLRGVLPLTCPADCALLRPLCSAGRAASGYVAGLHPLPTGPLSLRVCPISGRVRRPFANGLPAGEDLRRSTADGGFGLAALATGGRRAAAVRRRSRGGGAQALDGANLGRSQPLGDGGRGAGAPVESSIWQTYTDQSSPYSATDEPALLSTTKQPAPRVPGLQEFGAGRGERPVGGRRADYGYDRQRGVTGVAAKRSGPCGRGGVGARHRSVTGRADSIVLQSGEAVRPHRRAAARGPSRSDGGLSDR